MARRSLSRDRKREILERQGYICVGCGKAMSGATNIEFDHRRDGLPRWFFDYEGSEVDPDDQDYLYAMHRACHGKLYPDDAKRIAKTKRQMGERGSQYQRRLLGK